MGISRPLSVFIYFTPAFLIYFNNFKDFEWYFINISALENQISDKGHARGNNTMSPILTVLGFSLTSRKSPELFHGTCFLHL